MEFTGSSPIQLDPSGLFRPSGPFTPPAPPLQISPLKNAESPLFTCLFETLAIRRALVLSSAGSAEGVIGELFHAGTAPRTRQREKAE